MEAFAQSGGAAAPTNPTVGFLLMLLQFLPIILIFYFLIIRPQQQRQKQLQQMLKNLKKGDKVLTQAGIYGTVIGFDDTKAVLKIAEDTKVEFSKSAIVQVLSSEAQG